MFSDGRILIYEGGSKNIYLGPEPGTLIISFKKGENDAWRARISESLWTYLAQLGIRNHFVKALNIKEHVARSVDVCSIFAHVYNISDDSLRDRFGIEIGTHFPTPLIEWRLNSPTLGNPVLCREHIYSFRWLDNSKLDKIKSLALRVNDMLKAFFIVRREGAPVELSAVKVHFGFDKDEMDDDALCLVGEMSPENIALWDGFSQMDEKSRYDSMKGIGVGSLRGSGF